MGISRISDRDADRLLGTALDLGINFFDLSRDYRTSEERLGRVLAGRRHEAVVATKCGCNPHLETGRGHVHTFDRKTLERNLEESLRALRTDYIDLWQLHGATPEKLVEGREGEVVETMQRSKEQGKVRSIGVSFRHGPKTERGFPTLFGYQSIEEVTGWQVFDVLQIVYGAMVRTNEQRLAVAAEQGAGIVVRGAVRDYFESFPRAFKKARLDELLDPGEDRRSFLIRYALSHPAVASVLIGTRSVEHLRANARAMPDHLVGGEPATTHGGRADGAASLRGSVTRVAGRLRYLTLRRVSLALLRSLDRRPSKNPDRL
jgi:aryl-alcohol dehydrogenase-like predicted oxidoreductase